MESQTRIQKTQEYEFQKRYLELISDFYKYRLLVYELVSQFISIELKQQGDEGILNIKNKNIHFF